MTPKNSYAKTMVDLFPHLNFDAKNLSFGVTRGLARFKEEESALQTAVKTLFGSSAGLSLLLLL